MTPPAKATSSKSTEYRNLNFGHSHKHYPQPAAEKRASLLHRKTARRWRMFLTRFGERDRNILPASKYPMNSAEEIRMKAEAYPQAALNTKDDESRRAYLSLMAAWREIAHQVARIEQVKRN